MILTKALRDPFSSQIYGIPLSPKERLKLSIHSLSCESPLLLTFSKRKFHAFCIGLPRSGTHTIACLFNGYYAAAHEPDPKETIIRIMDWNYRKSSKAEMLKFLSFRDRTFYLDLESSHYLHHIVDLLVEKFPQAKFILTVREPLSWLESEVNQNYITRDMSLWRSLERYRYSRYDYGYEFGNLIGIENIYPIRSYLSYWKDHVSKVINGVSPENLLIVDTFKISQEVHNIASFLDISSENLYINMNHSNKRNRVFNLYEAVNRNNVQKIVRSSCYEFIQRNLSFMINYLDL